MTRYLAQVSCGAASACAWKLAADRYGDAVEAVNAFLDAEHEDNRRFLADCEQWVGRKVTVLRDEKYGASPLEVWKKKRFIVHAKGAPCSSVLKRGLLHAYERPGDVIVLGFDAGEEKRLDRWIDANAGKKVWAPLIEAGMSKQDCFAMLFDAGIELPLPYRLGYHNANCLVRGACPKGGMGYWNKVRIDFPDSFDAVARIQDVLGQGSYFFRNRKTGERISLRDLDPNAGIHDDMKFSCGAVCEWPEGTLFAARDA